MTDLDAVTLAVLGYPRRRLLGALMRHWLARPLPDTDDLPAPGGAEPFVRWAARCVVGPHGDAAAELRQQSIETVTGNAAGARTGAAHGRAGCRNWLAVLRMSRTYADS